MKAAISPISVIQKNFNVWFNSFIYSNLEQKVVEEVGRCEGNNFYSVMEFVRVNYHPTEYTYFAAKLLSIHTRFFYSFGLDDVVSFEEISDYTEELYDFLRECVQERKEHELLDTELIPKMLCFFKSLDRDFKTDVFTKKAHQLIIEEEVTLLRKKEKKEAALENKVKGFWEKLSEFVENCFFKKSF